MSVGVAGMGHARGEGKLRIAVPRGALLGALNAGVPILAIPQGADQFLNAERIVETVIGLRLMPDELDARAVRDAVRTLIDDPGYGEAMRSHQAAIAAMPSPETVVRVLEAVVER